jgi:hypothetical protein
MNIKRGEDIAGDHRTLYFNWLGVLLHFEWPVSVDTNVLQCV